MSAHPESSQEAGGGVTVSRRPTWAPQSAPPHTQGTVVMGTARLTYWHFTSKVLPSNKAVSFPGLMYTLKAHVCVVCVRVYGCARGTVKGEEGRSTRAGKQCHAQHHPSPARMTASAQETKRSNSESISLGTEFTTLQEPKPTAGLSMGLG